MAMKYKMMCRWRWSYKSLMLFLKFFYKVQDFRYIYSQIVRGCHTLFCKKQASTLYQELRKVTALNRNISYIKTCLAPKVFNWMWGCFRKDGGTFWVCSVSISEVHRTLVLSFRIFLRTLSLLSTPGRQKKKIIILEVHVLFHNISY